LYLIPDFAVLRLFAGEISEAAALFGFADFGKGSTRAGTEIDTAAGDNNIFSALEPAFVVVVVEAVVVVVVVVEAAVVVVDNVVSEADSARTGCANPNERAVINEAAATV
jgi:hypothetical protein